MTPGYLHDHKDFAALLQILAQETGILAQLIEKDYWIMHVLFGLRRQGLAFELKGGTSLSKGYGIIDRFSEDIDLHIHPPAALKVNGNPKNSKPSAVQSRRDFYDLMADQISIDGIVSAERDHAFDDPTAYRSGGIRLYYNSRTGAAPGVKEGILLEAGFDTVTPNSRLLISSWAMDRALETAGIAVIDNRAKDIACYHPGYTFVEKLQTVVTKFRQERESGVPRANLMRQYYDLYCLLDHAAVKQFIGTPEYAVHKQARFPKQDLSIPIAENEALLLSHDGQRAEFAARYGATASLYYKGQPSFETLLERIGRFLHRL